jgi:alpha-L-fucosidase
MPNGEIEPRQAAVLKEVGAWLAKYGESIYATRGGPYRNGEWGGSTRKGRFLYLHIAKWNDGRLVLPPLEATIMKSSALSGGTVEINQSPERIIVTRPSGNGEAGLVRLEFNRPIDAVHSIEVVSP